MIDLDNKQIFKLAKIGAIVLLAIMIFGMAIGARNKAISLEENTNTSESNISKEEQRRLDLFNNLVDAIESYNNFEANALKDITEARAVGAGGDVDTAALMLAVVVEAYPELQSQKNYQTAQLEFSVTENRLAAYREQFNEDVRSYNNHTRRFPASMWLGVTGYDNQDYEYLDYEVDNSEARDLFDNE